MWTKHLQAHFSNFDLSSALHAGVQYSAWMDGCTNFQHHQGQNIWIKLILEYFYETVRHAFHKNKIAFDSYIMQLITRRYVINCKILLILTFVALIDSISWFQRIKVLFYLWFPFPHLHRKMAVQFSSLTKNYSRQQLIFKDKAKTY